MRHFIRRIELAVDHARSRGHALHVARLNACSIAHAVFVRERASHDIAHDFHIAMGMGAKSLARINAVFVDHSQISPAHMVRIVIIGKGKRVVALQPTVVSKPSLLRLSDMKHGVPLMGIVGTTSVQLAEKVRMLYSKYLN
jgi:hypothetical protein